jgi:hypothetical protein
MSKRDNIAKLEGLKSRLQAQISELHQQLAGVELSIKALSDTVPMRSQGVTHPRPANVRETLLEMLREQEAKGINAATAVKLAAEQNLRLERSTVSSMLSRFKKEGLARFDGSVYRPTNPKSQLRQTEISELLGARQ